MEQPKSSKVDNIGGQADAFEIRPQRPKVVASRLSVLDVSFNVVKLRGKDDTRFTNSGAL